MEMTTSKFKNKEVSTSLLNTTDLEKIIASPLQLTRVKHVNVGDPFNFEVLWSYNELQGKAFSSILKICKKGLVGLNDLLLIDAVRS